MQMLKITNTKNKLNGFYLDYNEFKNNYCPDESQLGDKTYNSAN